MGTPRAEWAVFIMAGKNKKRGKYGEIPNTHHFIPVIIILSKVIRTYVTVT